MKLIDITCPKCNAMMQVNSELTKCVCNYCGNELLIDHQQTEIIGGYQFGYEQEKGRQQAIADIAREKAMQERVADIERKTDLAIKNNFRSLERTLNASCLIVFIASGIFLSMILPPLSYICFAASFVMIFVNIIMTNADNTVHTILYSGFLGLLIASCIGIFVLHIEKESTEKVISSLLCYASVATLLVAIPVFIISLVSSSPQNKAAAAEKIRKTVYMNEMKRK